MKGMAKKGLFGISAEEGRNDINTQIKGGEKMKKANTIYIISFIVLVAAIMVMPATAKTIYVNETGWWIDPAHFNESSNPIKEVLYQHDPAGWPIYSGVDPGDTVFIYNGSYSPGFVMLWVPNITVRGEGADVMNITGTSSKFSFQNDSIILEGFTFKECESGCEVKLTAPDCIIRDCVFEAASFSLAIQLKAANTTFMNNVISNSPYDLGGIEIAGPNTTFINNVVLSSTGMFAAVSIEIGDCTVANNTIKDSTGAAISLCDIGSGCENNTITKNNLTSNAYAGIELYNAGSGNKIYLNNFIDNGVTATTSGKPAPAVTYWNSTEPIEYVYDSYEGDDYLGNYWSTDYGGTDGNGDGIGDTSYTVPDGLGEDYRPLMAGYENYPAPAGPEPTPTPTPTGPTGVPEFSPLGLVALIGVLSVLLAGTTMGRGKRRQ